MQAAWGMFLKKVINGEWVTLTYHFATCRKRRTCVTTRYMLQYVGCDNFAKVKCHGCDRKATIASAATAMAMEAQSASASSASARSWQKLQAAADRGWLKQHQEELAECANQCTKTANCIFGTFTESGECWLSESARSSGRRRVPQCLLQLRQVA